MGVAFALVYAWMAAVGNIHVSHKRMFHVAMYILFIWIYPLVHWASFAKVSDYFDQTDCYIAMGFFFAYLICGILFYFNEPSSRSSSGRRGGGGHGPEVVVQKEIHHHHHVAQPYTTPYAIQPTVESQIVMV